MEYKRLTKLSDLGTLHAMDFNGEEQPLCELTALDIDVLIGRLYELENKIESGELGDVKELKKELKAQEGAANAYRIFFEEQKYWREVAERALDLCETAYILSLNHRATEGISGQAIASDLGVHKFFIRQAEKELEEEKSKDDSPRT